jgi:CheY-like chemotaxis protein
MTAVGAGSSRKNSYRVLCVDDNQFGMYVNAIILRNEGYEVLTCCDAEKAAAMAKAEEIDVAVLDYQMPIMNGAELAAICKAENPEMKLILFSGHLGIPNRELAVFDLFVPKSEGIEALLDGIEALLPGSRKSVRFPATSLTTTSA